MDHFELHFDEDLFRFGRLNRLHKGADPYTPPNQPAKPGKPAETVEMQKEKDPKRKNRGYSGSILSTGLGNSSSSDNTTNSILGG